MPIHGVKALDGRLKKLTQALAKAIPARIGQDAENHFRNSFKQGGFTDKGFRKWPPRKHQPTDAKGKVRKHTVLFRTGMLRNSVRLLPNPSWNGIFIVAGGPHVPYARIHNEGGWIRRQATRRAHPRRAHIANVRGKQIQKQAANVRRHQVRMNLYMRKRQFMGQSAALDNTMRATVLRSIQAVMTK